MPTGETRVENERVDVEWLILADSAQVNGGKLFMLGGGWDVLTVNSGFPYEQPCAIAAAFKVPYSETNRPIDFALEVHDEDGHVLLGIAGKLEVGRPPGIPAGLPQRSQFAVNAVLRFDRPGTYVVLARIDGQEAPHRVPFSVVPGPGMMMRKLSEGAA
jgi:hypothetical protein